MVISLDEPLRVPGSDLEQLLHDHPGAAALQVAVRHPKFGDDTAGQLPVLWLNQYEMPALWGANTYLLLANTYRVRVAIRGEWVGAESDSGEATTTVTVTRGGTVRLYYSPPAWTFLDGRIGAEPQPRRGGWVITLLIGVVVLGALAFLASSR